MAAEIPLWAYGTAAAVLGLVVGSFMNVVAYRVPIGISVVRPRSHCPACGATISAVENIPVLSWVFQRGRCRSCQARISIRYPAIEAAVALLFVVVVATTGVHPELVLYIPFVALLVALSAIDLEHRIVPNGILILAACWAVVAGAAIDGWAVWQLLAAGSGAGVVLGSVALAWPGSLGMGDVKLAAVMGLYLGILVLPALAVAFMAGGVFAMAMILRYGSSARKRRVPFVPFLALGGVVGVLAGHWMIDLYISAVR